MATTVYETKIGVGATSQTSFNCKTGVKLRLRCRLVQCIIILNFLCLVKRIKPFWRTWLLFLKKFLHILYLLFLEGVSGSSNGSSEHLIRAKLLENYDKIVLPVTGKKMEVRFKLRIVKLLKVVSITQQRNRNGNQNCRNSRGALNGSLGRELCHRGLQTPTLFKTEIAHFPILFVKTCRSHYFPTLICFAYRIE